MPIMGISGTDLKHAGWNLTVATGVALTCALLARRVTEFSFNHVYNYLQAKPGSPEAKRAWNMAGWMGVSAGMGAASLLQWTISGSRMGLINNSSLYKMFTFAGGQAFLGVILDRLFETNRPYFTEFGVLVAYAGHWSRYSLTGIGAIGALVGGAKI